MSRHDDMIYMVFSRVMVGLQCNGMHTSHKNTLESTSLTSKLCDASFSMSKCSWQRQSRTPSNSVLVVKRHGLHGKCIRAGAAHLQNEAAPEKC